MFIQRYKGVDFDLVFSGNDYLIKGQPKNNFLQYSINYNGNNRQIDRETGLIIEKMMKARPYVNDIYQIKHAEIEKYYLNQLPPVDVVEKAPPKNGTKNFLNKKILGVPVWFVLLGVVGWAVFFTNKAKIRSKR